MYPTFEKIREIAAGDYKRIPICKELYADSYTPVEMMRILQKASHHCYLLESASQSEAWGRYSFLGYDPSMEITCTDGIPVSYTHLDVYKRQGQSFLPHHLQTGYAAGRNWTAVRFPLQYLPQIWDELPHRLPGILFRYVWRFCRQMCIRDRA